MQRGSRLGGLTAVFRVTAGRPPPATASVGDEGSIAAGEAA